jgi:hypothetical protein
MTQPRHLGTLLIGNCQRTLSRALDLSSRGPVAVADADLLGWDAILEISSTTRSRGLELVVLSSVEPPVVATHNLGAIEDLRT